MGSKITADGDCSHEIKSHLLLGRNVMTNLNSILKSKDITLPSLSSQRYGFSSSHVWIWELDYKESWVQKNWCFWTVVLEKTLESPLDSKEIQPVNSKGDQSWIFIGRTDAEAETPIIWPPHAKNWLIGKDLDPGKDQRPEEKGTTEDEMVGWHHWINGLVFEQAPGAGDGQRSLACSSPWGPKDDWATELTDGSEALVAHSHDHFISLCLSVAWWWTEKPGVQQSMRSRTWLSDWTDWRKWSFSST